MKELDLVQIWDKTFPKSDKVKHSKITFLNRYGIALVADLYEPKDNEEKKLPAIAVSGPFGAVKEQCSGLYAQTLAERGFITIAFDPSYTGESSGEPRYIASPDINTEDFIAAVDFLVTNPKVDSEKVGILGICGWGGMAINATALDPRIKATVASTMYDISRCEANGYFDAENTAEHRKQKRLQMADLRTKDFLAGHNTVGAGLPDSVPEDAPQFFKDYMEYYKHRGFHKRSLNGSALWSFTGKHSFLNQPLLCYANEIETPVLLIHGEKAHSLYFSEGAFEKMTGKKSNGKSMKEGNKELMIIPNAVHCDLYDNLQVIPFDKIEQFYRESFR
ncbi:MAG: alpha/beta hydrolase [Bacteroidales bacterium]|nr:alpha/beta hydrolase [Bacteroidales bacterium]